MIDAGEYCDIASSCLCGGKYFQAGNLPATGVLEATVTQSFVAQITATFGTTTGFAVGDAICVDQSTVGATILVPVSTSDAAQVVPPPPDGGTCVPNFAYTVLLDDGGRPLACNDGIESQLALTEQQAVAAMQAPDCNANLASLDARWADNECTTPGGCNESAAPLHAVGAAAIALIALAVLSSVRRRSARSAARASPPSSR